jgi:stage IV sporulation protein FB
LKSRERLTRVIDVAREPKEGLRDRMPLQQALDDMRRNGHAAFSVIDEDGKLVGMLTPQNVAEMLMIRQARPEWRFGRV